MTAMLEAKNLNLSFGSIVAFHDVSFSVEQGEIFAVIGPNGAGKSSLFNVLSRIYDPQGGALRLRDVDLLSVKARELAAHGVGRTFQNISLFTHLTVLENVMVGRHHLMKSGALAAGIWFGRTRREEAQHRERAREALELTGLSNLADASVDELSYGELKRVELARAIAMEPTLLLLDEPIAGIASSDRAEAASWITNVRDRTGATILLVEHDMNFVMSIADRVLVLDFGEVIALDTPKNIQSNPDVIRAYLGSVTT